jgi:hypothetical protein
MIARPFEVVAGDLLPVFPCRAVAVFEIELQKCSRRCAATGRELQAGDDYYSTLTSEGASIVRRDYGEEAWKGPPEDVIAWWKSKVPDPRARTMHWAPNDVMMHYFTELEGRDDCLDTRYILALLLIRRRIVRLEETEQDDRGRPRLVVYCPRSETEYRVAVALPSKERIAEIQEELARLLLANAA